MKWFKHMADANRDDKLVSIRTRFGMWGIGVYWTLVEKAAEQMKGRVPVPVAILSLNETCSLCGCKQNKLRTFLKHLQNINGMKHECSRDILKIEVKKLLEIKDNYHVDLGDASKKLPSKEVEEEVEEEEEVEVDKRVEDTRTRWNEYAEAVGISKILALSSKRKAGVRARLSEPAFNLDAILTEISTSDFLRGNNNHGWKVDFDFVFCSANNYLKILEGKYRNGKSTSGSRKTFTPNDNERIARAADEIKRSQHAANSGADTGGGTTKGDKATPNRPAGDGSRS